MEYQSLFPLLRSKIGMLVLFGLLFGALGFFGLMVTEKPFQTKMDFLVVQTNGQNQDFYTQFKSSEYLGNILGEAVYSERFINAVVETGKVNAEFLPFDKSQRLAAWKNMVSVEKNLSLGIISITINGNRERDVARIMEGATKVLTEQNALFRGGDEKSVEIRILSGPILESTPNLAKVLKVTLAAFLAGFFIATFFIVVKYETRIKKSGENAFISLNDTLV